MRKRLVALLTTVLVMGAVLVGCSGGGTSGAEEGRKAFAGTWAFEGMKSAEGELSENELELAKAVGMYLTLSESGGGVLEMLGIEVEGTWNASDASTAKITLSGSDATEAGESDDGALELGSESEFIGEWNLKLADAKLVMSSASGEMTFSRIDPSEKKASDLGLLLDEELGTVDLTDEADEEGIDSVSVLSDTEQLDITVADDAVCMIKVIAKGDYYGDPGFAVAVTNKGDSEIFVESDGEYNVNGMVAVPMFSLIVDAGKSGEEILWFSNSDVNNAGVAALSGVSGKLLVTDSATGEQLGTYDFAA